MDDLAVKYLYLEAQLDKLHFQSQRLRAQLLKKPKSIIIEAELERVKHDAAIILPLFNTFGS